MGINGFKGGRRIEMLRALFALAYLVAVGCGGQAVSAMAHPNVFAALADVVIGEAFYAKGEYSSAQRLFRPAAEQGFAPAQFSLGLMYAEGKGVPQDYAQAVDWYRKAAEQGYSPAMFSLGRMYDLGEGVPQGYAQAVDWYRKAAEQGYSAAQINLGLMYGKGQGVPQDYVQAHKWYNLAGASSTDTENRNIAFKNRDIVASKMTPEQIAEAQRLAGAWKPHGILKSGSSGSGSPVEK
jgi:TPR repeat protein